MWGIYNSKWMQRKLKQSRQCIPLILLMEENLHQLVDSSSMFILLFTSIYKVLYIPGRTRFLPSTVYDPAFLQLRTSCHSHPHIAASPSPRLTDCDTADGDVFRGHRILAPWVSSWKPWYTTNLPRGEVTFCLDAQMSCKMPRRCLKLSVWDNC